MYKSILVPVALDDDGKTERALEVAETLAAPGASLTILHIIEAIPNFAKTYVPEDVMKKGREDAEKSVRAIADKAPLDAKGVLMSGHGGTSIVSYAEDHDIDCIVIGSHRPVLSDTIFGSTANHVVRHATMSVHVVR